MIQSCLYKEKISSFKTQLLFLALTILLGGMFAWRTAAARLDALAILLACFGVLFAFYSLNFRTLTIRLTAGALKLRFGVFTWTVQLDNIEACALDEVPPFLYYGGAGIHFFVVRERYRASFNFLEYPRVVVALKKKAGLVRDVSFSTRQPEELLRLIQGGLHEPCSTR